MEQQINEAIASIHKDVKEVKQLLMTLLKQDSSDKKNHENQNLMTAGEVARLLGVNLNVIYHKCAENDIPYSRIGKQYRFDKEAVLEWLKRQKPKEMISIDAIVENHLQKRRLLG